MKILAHNTLAGINILSDIKRINNGRLGNEYSGGINVKQKNKEIILWPFTKFMSNYNIMFEM